MGVGRDQVVGDLIDQCAITARVMPFVLLVRRSSERKCCP